MPNSPIKKEANVERFSRSRIQLTEGLILLLLLPSRAFGQGAGGTINGTVTDSTGAMIPAAKIEIVNAETGVVTSSETGINGVYIRAERHIRRIQHLR